MSSRSSRRVKSTKRDKEATREKAPRPMDSDDEDSEEKEAEPCNNYRVDTEGVNFGDCKCGWDKASHQRKSRNMAAEARNALRHDSDDEDEVNEKADSPCNNYRLDTEGANFGDCKCGWPKVAHQKTEQNHAALALAKLKAKSNRTVDQSAGGGDGPCNNFRLNTSAAEFGVCHCGYKRADHGKKGENMAEEALKNLRAKNKEKNRINDALAKEQVADRETAEAIAKARREEMRALEAKNNPKPEAPAIADTPQEAAAKPAGGGGCCVIS